MSKRDDLRASFDRAGPAEDRPRPKGTQPGTSPERGRGGFLRPGKHRPHRLSVDLTPDERALFKVIAIELGLPVTEMLRAAVWAIAHDPQIAAEVTRVGREARRGRLEWPEVDEEWGLYPR
jgi:hypothetical protein